MEIIESTVREKAYLLKAGEGTRVICPSCDATHEKSFTVQRDAHDPHKLWFRCWRAACGIHGRVTDAMGLSLRAMEAENDDALAATPILTTVPMPVATALAEQLEMDPLRLVGQGIQWDPFSKLVHYPWYNWKTHRRIQVGWQTRTEDKTIRLQKSLDTAQMYAVPMRVNPKDTGPTILVENLWSAYKLVALGHRAIALLGHRITHAAASSIREASTNRQVILLLDPDCWPMKVADGLRVLEARGWDASARHIDEKPHRMSNAALQELLLG